MSCLVVGFVGGWGRRGVRARGVESLRFGGWSRFGPSSALSGPAHLSGFGDMLTC